MYKAETLEFAIRNSIPSCSPIPAPDAVILVVEGGEDDLKFVKSDLIALLNCERAVFSEVPAVGSIKVFESTNAIYTPIAVTITVAVLFA